MVVQTQAKALHTVHRVWRTVAVQSWHACTASAGCKSAQHPRGQAAQFEIRNPQPKKKKSEFRCVTNNRELAPASWRQRRELCAGEKESRTHMHTHFIHWPLGAHVPRGRVHTAQAREGRGAKAPSVAPPCARPCTADRWSWSLSSSAAWSMPRATRGPRSRAWSTPPGRARRPTAASPSTHP